MPCGQIDNEAAAVLGAAAGAKSGRKRRCQPRGEAGIARPISRGTEVETLFVNAPARCFVQVFWRGTYKNTLTSVYDKPCPPLTFTR